MDKGTTQVKKMQNKQELSCKNQKDPDDFKITVVKKKSWTSPLSKKMRKAGLEASAAAIRQAKEAGVPISYMNENGEIITTPVTEEMLHD